MSESDDSEGFETSPEWRTGSVFNIGSQAAGSISNVGGHAIVGGDLTPADFTHLLRVLATKASESPFHDVFAARVAWMEAEVQTDNPEWQTVLRTLQELEDVSRGRQGATRDDVAVADALRLLIQACSKWVEDKTTGRPEGFPTEPET